MPDRLPRPPHVDHSRVQYPSRNLTLETLQQLDPISYRILIGDYTHEQAKAAEETPLPFKRLLAHERGLAEEIALETVHDIGNPSKLKDRLVEMYAQWGLAPSTTQGLKLAWDIEKQVEAQLGFSLNQETSPDRRRPSPPRRGR